MINRRGLLSGVVAAPIVLQQERALAVLRNPKDFGTVGAGDDTAAINAAFSAIRTDGYGVLELDGAQSAGGYARFYDVGSINAQYCSRSTLQLHSGIVLRGSQMSTPAAILDYGFSHEVVLDIQGAIYGGVNGPWGNESPSPAPVRPLCGILAGGDADKILIRSPKVTGWFKSACIGAISCASIEVEGQAQLIQRQPVMGDFGPSAPPALVLSSNPGEWGLQSVFTPLTNNVNAVVNFIWRGGEIHQINGIGGAGTGWPIYMRGIQVAAFRDVLIDTSRSAYGLFQGPNSDIIFDGCCFRNAESSGGLPANPVSVFEGGATNLRVYAPSPNNLQDACTGTPWAGTFTGASGQF